MQRRQTKTRHIVLDALTSLPQSAEDIFIKLKKQNQKIDLATVYRNLNYFSDQGLVLKTIFQDKKAQYELSSQKHHHHLVCNYCGEVKTVLLEEKKLLDKVKKQYPNFTIEAHTLEFFGKCQKCQK